MYLFNTADWKGFIQMTLISFAFSLWVFEGHSCICSHSQKSPTGPSGSTASTLPRKDERLEYHVQHNVRRKTAASVWWLPFCVCVPSLPFNNNNRRGPNNASSPVEVQPALLLRQYLTPSGVRMLLNTAMILCLQVSRRRSCYSCLLHTLPGFNRSLCDA